MPKFKLFMLSVGVVAVSVVVGCASRYGGCQSGSCSSGACSAEGCSHNPGSGQYYGELGGAQPIYPPSAAQSASGAPAPTPAVGGSGVR